MASDAPLSDRMRCAAILLDAACALLEPEAEVGSQDHLRDELGLGAHALRSYAGWLRTEAGHVEREASRDA